jgi:3-hydroxymyristoyl/3-hydroxydecanoyl-(acyl carrier protein) dehydratase
MSLQADIERATLAFTAEGDTGQATLRFHGDEVFFDGHFPQGPVLPAVVQIAAALHFGSKLADGPLQLVEVTRAKFTNPTGPGCELALQLELAAAEDGRRRLKAILRDGDNEVSELSLRVVSSVP